MSLKKMNFGQMEEGLSPQKWTFQKIDQVPPRDFLKHLKDAQNNKDLKLKQIEFS